MENQNKEMQTKKWGGRFVKKDNREKYEPVF